jgi:hypothetical protein
MVKVHRMVRALAEVVEYPAVPPCFEAGSDDGVVKQLPLYDPATAEGEE